MAVLCLLLLGRPPGDPHGMGTVQLTARVHRLLRLLRLVRLAKIKQLAKTERVVHNVYLLLRRFGVTKLQVAFYFRAVILVLIIVGTGHIVGCVWLMLGRHQALEQTNPAGWMVGAYQQVDEMGSLDINRTRDFISCIGGTFDALDWNMGGCACAATLWQYGRAVAMMKSSPAAYAGSQAVVVVLTRRIDVRRARCPLLGEPQAG